MNSVCEFPLLSNAPLGLFENLPNVLINKIYNKLFWSGLNGEEYIKAKWGILKCSNTYMTTESESDSDSSDEDDHWASAGADAYCNYELGKKYLDEKKETYQHKMTYYPDDKEDIDLCKKKAMCYNIRDCFWCETNGVNNLNVKTTLSTEYQFKGVYYYDIFSMRAFTNEGEYLDEYGKKIPKYPYKDVVMNVNSNPSKNATIQRKVDMIRKEKILMKIDEIRHYIKENKLRKTSKNKKRRREYNELSLNIANYYFTIAFMTNYKGYLESNNYDEVCRPYKNYNLDVALNLSLQDIEGDPYDREHYLIWRRFKNQDYFYEIDCPNCGGSFLYMCSDGVCKECSTTEDGKKYYDTASLYPYP